jgi:Periplasmic binding protein-like domain
VIETAALNALAGQRAGAAIAEMPARQRPTAAFRANDLVALGLLQEMTRRTIRVPDNVGIVGYDDIEFAAAAAVPLSSVRQPRHEIGRTAAQLLLEEALGADRHQHRQVIFQPELEVRRSTQARPKPSQAQPKPSPARPKPSPRRPKPSPARPKLSPAPRAQPGARATAIPRGGPVHPLLPILGTPGKVFQPPRQGIARWTALTGATARDREL